MATTYNLRTTTTGFPDGAADFSKLMNTGADGSPTALTVGVANSTDQNNTPEISYGYTETGIPGNTGVTGDYSFAVAVVVADAAIFLSISVSRVNSSNAVQTTSAATTKQNLSAATTYNFSLTGINIGPWNTGDKLRVNYRFTSSNQHGGEKSVQIYHGDNSTRVTAPWDTVTYGDMTGTAAGSSTAAGTAQGLGNLTGSATGSSTAAASMGGIVDMTGAPAGTYGSFAAGTMEGYGVLAASSAGTSTGAGAAEGYGELTGTGAGLSTPAGAMGGLGDMTGSAAGASTAAGTMDSAPLAGDMTGSSAGVSVGSGTMEGHGELAGSSAGTSAGAGTAEGYGELTGTGAGLSTGSGTMEGHGELVGSSAGTSAGAGTAEGYGDLAGTGAGISTGSGTLDDAAGGVSYGNMSGTASGTSTAAGAMVGTGELTGAPAGTYGSFAAGTMEGYGVMAGSGAGASVAAGAAEGYGELAGIGSGVSVGSGTLDDAMGGASYGNMAGTGAGVSAGAGILHGLGDLAGLGAGSATATATLTAYGPMAGIGTGSSSGTATATGLGQMVASANGASVAVGLADDANYVPPVVTGEQPTGPFSLTQHVFRLEGAVTADAYLAGHYRWGTTRNLHSAQLLMRAPVAGQVVIGLEVNGNLQSAHQFKVGPGVGPVRRLLRIGLSVAAGQLVRWRVISFTGAPGEEAVQATVMLSTLADSYARALELADPLEVRWVNGDERLLLWTYDPVIHAYIEAATNVANGRASITVGPAAMTVSIQGQTAMEVDDTSLRAALRGGAVRRMPRLEFWKGQSRLGLLSKTEFAVGRINEGSPAGVGGFRFGGSSNPNLAELTEAGLTAVALEEP